ncbi:hypothetical protein Rsub_07151 [Raphidocelis subcapitata]|uniref:Protein kinase domain-containing protein n=1 Tax=Raphidocelis subcapitata TaxID=307507 RepID=A0A2V0P2R1_9CHLO|nr:hypothetical protein Rsub_07151 [Raphidocelis subcapitata]|eukprot:GBF94164.1 hypothetical protein Rsub_07151 [Raphidocelis subcapitata]
MAEKNKKLSRKEIEDARLRRTLGIAPYAPPLPYEERKPGGPPQPVPLLRACRLPSTEHQLERNLAVARWLLSVVLPPLARLHEVGAAHNLLAPISLAVLHGKPPPGSEEPAPLAGVFFTTLEAVSVVPAAPGGRAAGAWLRAALSSPLELLPFLPPEALRRIARGGGLPQVPDGRVVACMTREADVWALGMTVWAAICGSGTPSGRAGRELEAAAAPGFSGGGSGLLATHFLAQARRGFGDHPLWPRLPHELRALLAATLVWEPAQRPTARQLLQNEFVARAPELVPGLAPQLRPRRSLLLARKAVIALHARAGRAAGAALLRLPAFHWTFEDDPEQFMAMIDPRTRDIWGRPRWEPYECARATPEAERPNPVALLAARLREAWLRVNDPKPPKPKWQTAVVRFQTGPRQGAR